MDLHKLEAEAIDKIRARLMSPVIRERGETAAQISVAIGVAVGYVNRILRDSAQGFRRLGYRWVVDDSGLVDWQEWSKRPDHWSQRRNDNLAPKFYRDANGGLCRVAFDGSVITVPDVFSLNGSARNKRKVIR